MTTTPEPVPVEAEPPYGEPLFAARRRRDWLADLAEAADDVAGHAFDDALCRWRATPAADGSTEAVVAFYLAVEDANKEWDAAQPPLPDLAALRARYTPTPVPPCRVCGGPLSIARMGGGEATEYACSESRPTKVGEYDKWLVGHYRRSHWTQLRPGDPDILALLDLLQPATTEKES